MSARDKALQFIRMNGPAIPIKISKHMGMDIILSGAILSELVSNKKLQISKAQIGSSPVYFINGQESRVAEMVRDHLKPREKEALDELRQFKVLRDSEVGPVNRIALRNLKDFAVPLDVTSNGGTERFWKFISISESEASELIEEKLRLLQPKTVEDKEIEPELTSIKEELKEEIKEEDPKSVKEKLPVESESLKEELSVEEPKKEELKEIVQKTLIKEPPLKKEAKELKPKKSKPLEGAFYNKVIEFFEKNEIEVTHAETIKKGKEFNFKAHIPSPVGTLYYFIKAKDKKSLSDSDLHLAYAEGQQNTLPTLFLVTGKPSKKAEKVLTQLKGQLIMKEL